MELWERIVQLGDLHAIDFIGAAGIDGYQEEIASIGGAVADGFPRALAIGIVIPQGIVQLLRDRESYENQFQYRTHGYTILNNRLDQFASLVSSLIQKNGYRAMPIPAAERIDSRRVCASISHKITARLAGFGWIGKNCLLITPEYGPGVRWTTVLTDAPLEVSQAIMENRCGGCNQCVQACPAQAIKGRNYVDGEARELRLEVAKCEGYFQKLKHSKRLGVCGMCIYACPYGKRGTHPLS